MSTIKSCPRSAVGGRTSPGLWERVKRAVTASGCCGTKPGQWSARKGQESARRYRELGGGYCGPKTNAQRSMARWTREDWTTKSGKPSSLTRERYLPGRVLNALTPRQYAQTTAKKRQDTRRGKQFSSQPPMMKRLTARLRGALGGRRSLKELV